MNGKQLKDDIDEGGKCQECREEIDGDTPGYRRPCVECADDDDDDDDDVCDIFDDLEIDFADYDGDGR